jgi:hypothetical protein
MESFLDEKFFDTDPGSCQPWIRDGESRILCKHPGSATLVSGKSNSISDQSFSSKSAQGCELGYSD